MSSKISFIPSFFFWEEIIDLGRGGGGMRAVYFHAFAMNYSNTVNKKNVLLNFFLQLLLQCWRKPNEKNINLH